MRKIKNKAHCARVYNAGNYVVVVKFSRTRKR